MPFEKFEDAEAIDNERRKAIAKSIRTISVEELKKLGEEIFDSPDRLWRQTFLSLVAENPGGTFHHAVTSEGVVFLYYVHENVCLQYHDASPLRTGLMVRRVSFHFRDRSASAPHARSSWRHVSFEKNPAESLRIHFGEHRKLFRNGDSKQGVGVNLLFHQLRRSGDQRIRKLAAECAHAQARRRTLRTVLSSRKDRSPLNANRQRLLRPASTPAFPHAR